MAANARPARSALLPDDSCASCFALLEGRAQCSSGACDASPPPHALPVGTTLVDRFLIGRVLGRGGFGITYLAWDAERGERTALKEYFPLDIAARMPPTEVRPAGAAHVAHFEFGLARFLEEAATLVALADVRGVVPSSGLFEANGSAYLAMRYLEGETLDRYLTDQGGRLDVTEALAVTRAVLRTLHEIHARDWLHRDISPDNIYLCAITDRPSTAQSGSIKLTTGPVQVMLLDFGAARQALGGRTQNIEAMLKPGYAPCEQYQTVVKLGPSADIYAVAATLFHLLTGAPPAPSNDRLLGDDDLSWTGAAAGVPAPLRAAIEHGLAVRAAHRPQTALEFERMLTDTNRSPAPQDADAPRSVKPGTYRIGRAHENEVVIEEDTVSQRHATLSVNVGQYMQLFDQHSTNGTFVFDQGNWSRVGHLGQRVRPESLVRFGEAEVTVSMLTASLPALEANAGIRGIVSPAGHSPIAASAAQPASRGRRLAAFTIDLVPFAMGLVPTLNIGMPFNGTVAVIGLVFLALLFLVQSILIGASGQSIGKLLLHLRIVDDKHGRHAGAARTLIVRTWLNTLACFTPLIGWGYFLVDSLMVCGETRRCLHDHLAGTRVVHERRG